MNKNPAQKDTRLLEALDCIDLRFVDETRVYYKHIPSVRADADERKKRYNTLRSLKYLAAVAACALLLSTIIPVVQYISGNPGSFLPSGLFETTEEYDPPYWEYTPELEPLSKELVEEIEEAYLPYILKMTPDEYIAQFPDDKKEDAQKSINNIRWIKKWEHYCIYYGTFNDSVVVANMGNYCEGPTITIAGYSMTYPYDVTVLVYNNGAFYDIEKAYETGLLTDNDIKIIAERHGISMNKK